MRQRKKEIAVGLVFAAAGTKGILKMPDTSKGAAAGTLTDEKVDQIRVYFGEKYELLDCPIPPLEDQLRGG